MLVAFTVLMSLFHIIYSIWKTEENVGFAESIDFFKGSIQLFGLQISVLHFKWIRHGLEISKSMMITYRHLHLILSAHYAAHCISGFSESPIYSGIKRESELLNSKVKVMEDWKKLTCVFKSINRAHGLYLLVFFPGAILILIIGICAQFVYFWPKAGVGRVLYLIPSIWVVFQLIIFMELGHTLEIAVSIPVIATYYHKY